MHDGCESGEEPNEMNLEQLDQMIADLERQQQEAAAVLPHLRAARAALDRPAPDAGSEPPPKHPKASANGHGHSTKKNLFEPKFKKPGRELIVDVLRGLDRPALEVGLSLRQLQEALAAQETAFSDQFVNFALKQLQEDGQVQKVPAPKSAKAKWNYRIKPGSMPMEGR
jgi:hypothetical protein